MKPTRKHLPHDVPNWIDPTQEPRGTNHLAKPKIWEAILASVAFREQCGDWSWRLILAMPDHLHGIVIFSQQFQMQKAVANWKRWLATQKGIRWQDGFFRSSPQVVGECRTKGGLHPAESRAGGIGRGSSPMALPQGLERFVT
jgi:hypothetical protein